jgi:hypothetical protein
VPCASLKRKNTINERLFVPPPAESYQRLNPYARISPTRPGGRGIAVDVLDAEWGASCAVARRAQHRHAGVAVRADHRVAMSRCDDKRVTRRIAERAGLSVPSRAHRDAVTSQDLAFLAESAT